MTGVPATLLEGSDKVGRARKVPGAIWYADKTLLYACPCGCQRIGGLNLDPDCGRPLWTMSGPRDRPTITPSVNFLNDDLKTSHWHGWLRAGVWRAV